MLDRDRPSDADDEALADADREGDERLMFYCDACAQRNGWPDELWMLQSHGPCEVCGLVAACYDVRSSDLPPVPADATRGEGR
jgi:hypothetical protein